MIYIYIYVCIETSAIDIYLQFSMISKAADILDAESKPHSLASSTADPPIAEPAKKRLRGKRVVLPVKQEVDDDDSGAIVFALLCFAPLSGRLVGWLDSTVRSTV